MELVMTNSKQLKNVSVTMRLEEDIFLMIDKLSREERRSISDVARLLLSRGINCYKRDKKLFDEESNENGSSPSIAFKRGI